MGLADVLMIVFVGLGLVFGPVMDVILRLIGR